MGYMKSADIARREAGRRRVPQKEDRERYLREWQSNMIRYWRERIDRLRVIHTGHLRSSIEGELLLRGATATIVHRFPAYGKYQDDGTGREFGEGYTDRLGREYTSSRGGEGTWNSGQLPFLLPGGEEYRRTHGLDRPKKVGPAWGGRMAGGHPRKRKPWYWQKYYASRMVLNELEQQYFGDQYMGMFTQALDEVFAQTRIL